MHEPNRTAVILGEAFLAAMREAVREEIQVITDKPAPLRDKSPSTLEPVRSYLTIKEAATVARLGPSTIRLLIRKRKLTVRKIGRRVIVRAADLEKFLEADSIESIKN